jgi:exonuclease SbcC
LIPLRLNLRNFMCYTDVHEPLDFSGIHVACLSGQNGHGKSTLLDAITWALWGRSRARTADELIHSGRTEMEVELEFLLDEQRYRVIRKRDSRARGQTVLELAVFTGDGWRALTGDSLAETERQIQQLLRMSYETFTHSSFIMQGKADTFTTATPAQRKQVLAEILGLSYYDELESQARDEARKRQEQAGSLRLRIDETERELARKPALEEERQRCESRLAEIAEGIEQAEARLAAAQSSLAQLVSAESQLEDVRRNLESLRNERNQTQRRCQQLRERLEKADSILARSSEVADGFERLKTARQELESLNGRLREHARLTAEIAVIEREIAALRGAAETTALGLREKVASLESTANQLPELRRRRVEIDDRLRVIVTAERRRSEIESKRHDMGARVGALRGANERLLAEMVSLRERITQLDGARSCPLCLADIPPERHQHVTGTLESQGQRLKQEYQRNHVEATRAESDATALSAEYDRIVATLAEGPTLQGLQVSIATSIEQGCAAESELKLARERLIELTRSLEAQSFAAEQCARLVPLRRQLEELEYRPERHDQLRVTIDQLQQFESAFGMIEQAQRAIAEDRPHLQETEASLARLSAMVGEVEQRAALLTEQARGVGDARVTAEAAENEARQRRRERDAVADELAGVRQQLQFCERQAEIRAELEKELNNVLTEQGIYADLALALGKNGVQAMLIDTAIPELDEHANQLLTRMTDGRMNLKLEMQRITRGGGMAETLDIKIGDELGTRGYELYSGGEAFRINFALRIALSRLLARRAGASLQTLVIDEGFGSQDADGRDRIVDAIKAIQDDFEKILVITHISELKDVFPVRIEVEKTSAGSLIKLT